MGILILVNMLENSIQIVKGELKLTKAPFSGFGDPPKVPLIWKVRCVIVSTI